MKRAVGLFAFVLLGATPHVPALAAVGGPGVTVVGGRVTGEARDVPFADMVEEVVARAGGSVDWLASRPQWRTTAAFAAEPVVEALRRLLDGGSMTIVLGPGGQVRRVVVLESPGRVGTDPDREATAAPQGVASLLAEQADRPPTATAERHQEAERRRVARLGRPGRDADIPALLAITRGGPDDTTVSLAVAGLARIGSPRAIAELATLAQHGADEMLRSDAGKQLESLTHRDATARAMFDLVTEAAAGDAGDGEAISKGADFPPQ